MARTQVLVVQDDSSLRPALLRLLQKQGFEVLTADSSTHALTIVRTQEPALALVDVRLPGTADGFDLCRRIWEWVGTEVILMTEGLTSVDDLLRAYREGAVNFVAKTGTALPILREVRRFFDDPKPMLQCSGAASGSVKVKTRTCLGKVLVVEDNEYMLSAISLHLEGAGFLPYPAETGQRGIMLAYTLKPDAIVLDVGLPDLSGNDVLGILKSSPRTKDIPVLVWTGSERRGQETGMLDSGASQYLIKGVNDVSAIPLRIKRELGIKAPSGELERGPVKLDVAGRSVWVFGEPLADLSPKEFDLLAHLVGKSPAVVKWVDILADVWGTPAETSSHETIEVHARTLRAKLGKAGCCVVTHKGVGLQFDGGRFRGKPAK